MGAALLLGLMAAIMIPWLGDDDSDEEPISPEPEEAPIVPLPEETPVVPDAQPSITVTGLQVEGTEAGDNITLADIPTTDSRLADGIVVNGNGGDDILDLVPETGVEPEAFGPDVIFDSSISGGDGNDTITVYDATGSRVFGGAGDDLITVTENEGDRVIVEAGSGNDTIDASDVASGLLYGDDGDDTILVSGTNGAGTGQTAVRFGGAGDDLIDYESSPLSPLETRYENPLQLVGGEDADTFRIVFDQGSPISDQDISEGTERVTMATLVVIDDFEPGIDTLEIDASVTNSAYELSEVRLEEDEQEGTTNVIVSYTSETEVNRDVVITVNATGVDIDDLVLPDGLAMEEVA